MDNSAQNLTLSTKHSLFVDETAQNFTLSTKHPLFVDKLTKTCTLSTKHPIFVEESAVFLPVGRLQSVRSVFSGAIRDENWCFTPECLSSSTFPGLKFQFSSRTALFKPLGLARANITWQALNL